VKRNRARMVYVETSVIRDDDDVEIEVSGYYEPEQHGGMFDESFPAWVSDICAELDGKPFELTEEEVHDMRQKLLEKANEQH
jgi:hypothetical protein